MNLYEVLGVAKDATPEQIKKAFRGKASRAHPDHGGSEERMAALNDAYAVLSDPERRKLYDETGATQAGPTLRSRAEDAIARALTAVIDAGADDLLTAVREGIDANLNDVIEKIANLVVRRRRLKKLSGRFKCNGEVNIVQGVIDQQLGMIPTVEKQLSDAQAVLLEARRVLSEYTDDSQLMQQPTFVTYSSPFKQASFGYFDGGPR